MALPAGIDPQVLSQTGWAVVFPDDLDPEVPYALDPLIDKRKSESGNLFQELHYRKSESFLEFLTRHGLSPGGDIDPQKLPYYLLLAGSPELIPFEFQTLLGLEYATGRLSFETPEEYHRYAVSVVQAESNPATGFVKTGVFGVENSDDAWTRQVFEALVQHIAELLSGVRPDFDPGPNARSAASKQVLQRVLAGSSWRVVFTASHGLSLAPGHPQQKSSQGALICQDWPGPEASGRRAMNPEWYFAGSDVRDDAKLLGRVTLHLSSYSAGCPELDECAPDRTGQPRRISNTSIVSALAQRMLAHPRGGALAFLGHIDRVLGFSIPERSAREADLYRGLLWDLSRATRAGYALRAARQAYATSAAALATMQDDAIWGKPFDPVAVAEVWAFMNDMRSLVILGDPAVRVCEAPA